MINLELFSHLLMNSNYVIAVRLRANMETLWFCVSINRSSVAVALDVKCPHAASMVRRRKNVMGNRKYVDAHIENVSHEVHQANIFENVELQIGSLDHLLGDDNLLILLPFPSAKMRARLDSLQKGLVAKIIIVVVVIIWGYNGRICFHQTSPSPLFQNIR